MTPLDELRFVVETLHEGLDKSPYHEILGVGLDASGDQLRTAFHERARAFHPDQFFGVADPGFKSKVYAVYKRMTEAYRIMSDPDLRKRYEEQRKKGAVRYDATQEVAAPKRPQGEPEFTVAGAKKYYQLAKDAERRGDKNGVRMNLKFAAQMEPGNEVLKALLDKAMAK